MGSDKSPHEQPRQSSPRVDDLTRIQGIGPVIEQRLHDAGIVTYAQLAALSFEQIAGLIQNLPLLSVERIARQDWPGQARALAAASALGDSIGSNDAFEPHAGYATFTIELLLDGAGHVHRTNVLHDQAGAANSWDGWDEDQLLRFLATHATFKAATPIPEAATQVAPGSIGAPGRFASTNGTTSPAQGMPLDRPAEGAFGGARLELQFLRVDEVRAPRRVATSTSIPHAQAQLSFRIDGPGAAQLIAQAPHCVVQLIAYDQSSGASVILATGRSQLVADQLEYLPTLEFALPEDGRYQLVGLAWIAESRLVGSALGPVLRVVP